MKKIIHIVDSMERGGQENFILTLAKQQQRKGNHVTIICIFVGGVLAEHAKKFNISVLVLKGHEIGKLSTINRLRSIISSGCYDLIHTHNRRPLVFAMLSSFGQRHKIINTRHGNKVKGLYWSIAAFFAKKIINVSNQLFESSNFVNRHFLKFKNDVITNGIEIPKAKNLSPEKGSLIMVGRLNPVKNHLLALKIVRKCIDFDIPLTLKIVGEGPSRTIIEKAIATLNLEKYVFMLGDRSDVPTLLSNADMFLLTSISEGHSIALLEASAYGLPLLATNVGGNSEIVQYGKTGWYFDLEDIDGFVTVISNLVVDRKLRERISILAQEWANQNANIEICSNKYSEFVSA